MAEMDSSHVGTRMGESFITLTMDRPWFNSRREDAPTKAHCIEFGSDGQRQRRIRQGELIVVQWTSKQYLNFITCKWNTEQLRNCGLVWEFI